MHFNLNTEKAAQAAAFLLSRHHGQINYTVLLKLLYMADRRALIERGLPITGDQMVSMPKGPALSRVLDLLKGETMDPEWSRYVSRPIGYDVRHSGKEETDELSRYELSVLTAVDEELGEMEWWQIIRYVHDLPEWEDPEGSSRPIPPERILKAEGVPTDEIERIGRRATMLRVFASQTGS